MISFILGNKTKYKGDRLNQTTVLSRTLIMVNWYSEGLSQSNLTSSSNLLLLMSTELTLLVFLCFRLVSDQFQINFYITFYVVTKISHDIYATN